MVRAGAEVNAIDAPDGIGRTLLVLGGIFLAGLAADLVGRRTALPRVTLLLLVGFAVGPGAVLGNTAFGDPGQPATWWFGLPPLWLWQGLGWLSGVAL
ncbi:MAG: hypothetical protein R3263_05435, partial [Myxococcota bacterium]|nr:hypothetical protein [Myxococcota bacterium]